MNGLIALGAGIAALTGIGGGIGIGIATNGGYLPSARGCQQDPDQPAAGRCSGRRYRNFRLRCCTADHPVPGLIMEA